MLPLHRMNMLMVLLHLRMLLFLLLIFPNITGQKKKSHLLFKAGSNFFFFLEGGERGRLVENVQDFNHFIRTKNNDRPDNYTASETI